MPAIRIKEKERARALRGRGKSVNQISQALGISKGSVSVWVRDVRLTAPQKRRLRQRELEGARRGRGIFCQRCAEYRKMYPKPKRKPRQPRNVEVFFDAWTPNMAYVLGFFAADGCMFRNPRGSYYVAFYSTDQELIDTVKRLMGVTNKIEARTPKDGVRKRRYTIQIGSKKIFERLITLGFTPRKSCTLSFPKVPRNMLCHFVRGYFDGDGCIWVNVNRRKNRPNGNSPLFISSFTSGSKGFLKVLWKTLGGHAGLSGGTLRNHSHPGTYNLAYSIRDTRQLRKFMYPNSQVPCLERKRRKFYSFE